MISDNFKDFITDLLGDPRMRLYNNIVVRELMERTYWHASFKVLKIMHKAANEGKMEVVFHQLLDEVAEYFRKNTSISSSSLLRARVIREEMERSTSDEHIKTKWKDIISRYREIIKDEEVLKIVIECVRLAFCAGIVVTNDFYMSCVAAEKSELFYPELQRSIAQMVEPDTLEKLLGED